jgi:hypothetical protein
VRVFYRRVLFRITKLSVSYIDFLASDIKDVDSKSEYPTIAIFGQSETRNVMPAIITVNTCRVQTKIQLALLHRSTYTVSYNKKLKYTKAL